MTRKSDFRYHLPAELIAQQPKSVRTGSRLLYLDAAGGAPLDMVFTDLPQLLRVGDLLIFNDTRVIPARLFGTKETGGRIELLIERLLDAHRACVQIRASKTPRPGQRLTLDGGERARVIGSNNGFFEVAFDSPEPIVTILERIGHVPLPPYIDRPDVPADRERYQTVYARASGAVAAPTAGLHFDQAMMADLQARGVQSAFITLHIGAGTFQPVRVEALHEHRMHREWFELNEAACTQINRARKERRRVIAVGTTAVRALEAAATATGRVAPYQGETDIFIYPPYTFRIVDAMLTNFHLPESTLLMLVCAFAGTERVLAAYRHAVAHRYRFFSYGDAMFVECVALR